MEYNSTMRIFFKLQITHRNIQNVLDELEDYEPTTSQDITEDIFSGFQTGPRALDLGILDHIIKMEYIPDRYLLRFATKPDHILDVFKKIADAFEPKYPFNDTVRFFEYAFPFQSIPGEYISGTIAKSIQIPTLSKLNKILGKDLVPYSFSISYPQSPLTDEWTHFEFIPEAMNPTGSLLLRITKRTRNRKEMEDFLAILSEQDFPSFLLEWLPDDSSL